MSKSTGADAPAPHPGATPSCPGAPAPALPEGAIRSEILIVVNSPPLREFLQSTLRARFPFLAVQTVDSVREAVFRINAANTVLIFMDVRLRDGYGFELTRRLRRLSVNAKVVFLSSYDLPEYRDEAYRSGADHYLEKGAVSIDEIVALVQSAVTTGVKP